tara:strand:- start:1045 stop:1182 length:138 start_codon:yes stop_codon:yes gene_type:complete
MKDVFLRATEDQCEVGRIVRLDVFGSVAAELELQLHLGENDLRMP